MRRRSRSLLLMFLFPALSAPLAADGAYQAEGYVRASVRDADGAIRTREATAHFQEGDELRSVDVGFRGGANPPGYFLCNNEGELGAERPIGYWEILVGKGELQSCYGAGNFVVGTTFAVNPTVGELEIQTSTVIGSIQVRNGMLSMLWSEVIDGPVSMLQGGSGAISGSIVDRLRIQSFSGQSLPAVSITDSSLTRAGPWRASVSTLNTSVGSTFLDLPFGELVAQCEIGVDCRWEIVGPVVPTLRVGSEEGPNDVSMFGHSLQTSGASISWGSAFLFSGGAWESLAAMLVGFDSSLRLQLGAELDLVGNLTVGGQAEFDVDNPGTVADIDGNLNASAAQGFITVSDGAQIIVRGTLTLGPEATLDLQPGGTVYAAAVDLQGDVLENGGVLHVPEPEHALGAVVAIGTLLARARRVARDVEPA